MKRKTFGIEIKEQDADGGVILINTPSVDRDRDRVMSAGAQVDNYLRNPVVQFGHNYRDPWATVGRTINLDISPDGITARFVLRRAANEHDPQNIVRLLWAEKWIRTASIGFMPDPEHAAPNEFGGFDFLRWDLLEWSLVPIPANQDALRLAVKTFGDGEKTIFNGVALGGAVDLSQSNGAADASAVDNEHDDDPRSGDEPNNNNAPDLAAVARALAPLNEIMKSIKEGYAK